MEAEEEFNQRKSTKRKTHSKIKKIEVVTDAHSQRTTSVSTLTATPADPSTTPLPSPTDTNLTTPEQVVPSHASPMGEIFTFQIERGEQEIVDFVQQHRIENDRDETHE
ncbi:hypothetical protein BLNAU_569 [Blattamonas nauphoetae]|uniref:Uncharacterized protein n=1 Tax=Blattamonas nauphoetae TaxID=2049346 RepID=A0ABQ9YLN4_9EUKA|nr:hypothetical protein BLNAU_569 [Blattamonas nauphoetae]